MARPASTSDAKRAGVGAQNGRDDGGSHETRRCRGVIAVARVTAEMLILPASVASNSWRLTPHLQAKVTSDQIVFPCLDVRALTCH